MITVGEQSFWLIACSSLSQSVKASGSNSVRFLNRDFPNSGLHSVSVRVKLLFEAFINLSAAFRHYFVTRIRVEN